MSTAEKEEKKHIINAEADELLKECGCILNLCVHGEDSFEPILALAFASYLAENCNGVIYDPQSERSYYKNIHQKISALIKECFDELTPDTLLSHPFEEWL